MTKSKQLVDVELVVHVTEERVKVGYCDQFTHAECNEHISRAAKAVFEILKHGWADELRTFLWEVNKRKKELLVKGAYFTEQEIKGFFTQFTEILDQGDAEYQAAFGRTQAPKTTRASPASSQPCAKTVQTYSAASSGSAEGKDWISVLSQTNPDNHMIYLLFLYDCVCFQSCGCQAINSYGRIVAPKLGRDTSL
jgi:hypothetical protein